MMYENIEEFINEYGTDFSKHPIVLPTEHARKIHCSIPHNSCHEFAIKYFEATLRKYGSDLISISPKIYWGYADFVYSGYTKRHIHSFLIGNSEGVEVIFDPYIYKLHGEGTKVVNHKGVHLPYWWVKNAENFWKYDQYNFSGYLKYHIFTEVNSLISFTNQVLQKA